jgi:hypothetical protein
MYTFTSPLFYDKIEKKNFTDLEQQACSGNLFFLKAWVFSHKFHGTTLEGLMQLQPHKFSRLHMYRAPGGKEGCM